MTNGRKEGERSPIGVRWSAIAIAVLAALFGAAPTFPREAAAFPDSGAEQPCVEIATYHFPPGIAVDPDCLPVEGCYPREIYVRVRIIGVGFCRDGE